MGSDDPAKERARIQKEIENKRAHAGYIGDGLIELGNLLKGVEPERWLMEGEEQGSDQILITQRLRSDLDKRFNKENLKGLLGQIRELKRKAARLEKAARGK